MDGARAPLRLIDFEYHRPGKGTQVYRQFLVEDRPDLKVLLQPAYPGSDLYLPGRFAQERGAPILWFYLPGTWCDVGRLYLKERTFTGWYTNLCTPFEFRDGHIESTDLFLDFWQPQSGKPVWVDEDEFEAAVASGALSAELHEDALRARADVERLHDAGEWPPRVVTEADFDAYFTRITER